MLSQRDKLRDQVFTFLDEAVQYFQQQNNGIVPSRRQLLTTALELKKRKRLRRISITAKDVAHYYLQGGPDEFVRFTAPRRIRPKFFQTLPVMKLGMWHIDYADYQKNWADHNDGKSGFILAVENFTNKLFVHPCAGTNTAVWLQAIKKLISKFPHINSFYSDPDPVATSPKFKKLIHTKYNIRWLYLRKTVKSFLAERYIGLIKQRLSLTMALNSVRNNRIMIRWIDLIDPIVNAYNNEIIPNTTFRRREITEKNFDKFLQQLTGEKQPDMNYYLSRAGPFKNEEWNKKIFKFNLGQKVFINPKANYHLIKGKRFVWKESIKGNFDTKKFTISGRQLRATKQKKNTLVPVYSLLEFDRLFAKDYPPRNAAEQKKQDQQLKQQKHEILKRINFYENELIAVPMRSHVNK